MTAAYASELVRPLADKQVNHFYCTFLKIDENSANVLGRQIKQVGRPSFTFADPGYRHKGVRLTEPGRIDFDDVTAIFMDDSESLVTKALYKQLYKQSRALPTQKLPLFDMKVDVLTIDDRVVESFTLIDCWVIGVSHSEQIYAESRDNEITVRLRYRTAEYDFKDNDPLEG